MGRACAMPEPKRFCDLDCPHAAFPSEDAFDGSGSCRTFAAIRCALLGRLVHKNLPCPAGLPRGADTAKDAAGPEARDDGR